MTLRLEVKGMSTGEVADLRWYSCEDDASFSAVVKVDVGVARSRRSDSFYVRVVTLASLQRMESQGELLAHGFMVILRSYSYETLHAWVQETVASCAAATWEQSVEQLRRHFRWEFDYCT